VVGDFYELIEHVVHADSANTDFIKTSVRGLFMMLLLPEMEHFDFFALFEKTIRLLKHFAEELKKMGRERDNMFIINFLSKCVPKQEF
jgi:hypothetical protein